MGLFISCLLSGAFCVSVPLWNCDQVFFATLSLWLGWHFGVVWTSCADILKNEAAHFSSLILALLSITTPLCLPRQGCQGLFALVFTGQQCLNLQSPWISDGEIKSKHAGKYLNEYLLSKHLSPAEVLALPPTSARPQGHGYLISAQEIPACAHGNAASPAWF